MVDDATGAASAVSDFWRARRRARLREVLSLVSGRTTPLLNYDDVRRQFQGLESAAQELTEVPLDAIVGSVGRYNDFTREFLPRQDSDKERWVRVKLAMTGPGGLPPVDLYKIGDTYFVKDGNHRVSVMRELGARYIQAYVTPVVTRVPLSPDDDPDDIILKSEYNAFLNDTALDELRPEADLVVTAPGQYEKLKEHIGVHRYFMGIDQNQPIPYREAVAHWYDHVYLPVVRAIRSSGLLRGFEGRTETDLYLWLSEHRGRLEQELGWTFSSETIAQNFQRGARFSAEQRDALLERLTEDPGSAAEIAIANDILVGLGRDGEALEQALAIARRENATLYGLQAFPDEAAADAPEARRIRDTFFWRCDEEGVERQYAEATGQPEELLLERAGWVDLVVATLGEPVETGPQLGSPLRSLLRRCPRPLVVVPGRAAPLRRALLAYDGSARAEEALFAATYVAAKWELPLVVLSVAETGRGSAPALGRARGYLERFGLEASYVERRGSVADAIIATATERDCDVVLMGSYSYSRWLETVLGGVLDEVLGAIGIPVLVT